MANSLTNQGEEYMLYGDGDPGTDGGFARFAASARLYTSASTPNKDGTGFTEVANGNGYTTGGQAISLGDWTFSVVSTTGRITLANVQWNASGAGIANVAGAYIADSGGNVLAWWERTTVTVPSGDTITLNGLTIIL